MNVEFTNTFSKKAKLLGKKDSRLKPALKKQISLFKSNPLHPSVRLHKLKGARSEQFAIWIKGDLRALSIKSKTKRDTYIFFDLIKHDQY